jgi:signal transduction histidine kinase
MCASTIESSLARRYAKAMGNPLVATRRPGPDERSAWLRYGGALAVTTLALGTRFAMDPVWGDTGHPRMLLVPAIIVAAWLGGTRPGILASLLSTFGSILFTARPFELGSVVAFGVFLALGCFVSVLIGALHRAWGDEHSARVRAEAQQRARDELAAVLAHDLRNPLNAIVFNARAAKNATSDPALVSTRVDRIERAANRMNALIRDLLDAERLDGGRLELSMNVEVAASIVLDAVDAVHPAAEAKGIVVEHVVDPLPIACDRERLLQVFDNLLSNAITFTPMGGSISVRGERDGDFVRFEVVDTGPGIKPEFLPRVFDRHWSGAGGTGLGLYIARGIVDAHGGRIEARTNPGMGTAVRFWIRRAGEYQEEQAARPTSLRLARRS